MFLDPNRIVANLGARGGFPQRLCIIHGAILKVNRQSALFEITKKSSTQPDVSIVGSARTGDCQGQRSGSGNGSARVMSNETPITAQPPTMSSQ